MYLQAFRELNNLINSSLELDELLQIILDKTLMLIEAAHAGIIFLGHEKDDSWQIAATHTYTINEIPQSNSQYSQKKEEYKISGKEHEILRYTSQHHSGDKRKEKTPSETLFSWIVHEGKLLGAIQLDCFESDLHFSEDDINFLKTISTYVVTASRNTKLYSENQRHLASLQQKIDENATMYEISKSAASTLNTEEVIDLILESVKKLIHCSQVSFFRYNSDRNLLILTDLIGTFNKSNLGFEIEMGKGVAGNAAKSGKPIIVNNPQESEYFLKELDLDNKIYNMISIPIYAKKKLIGVLDAINKDGGDDFNLEDERLLKQFASNISIALENANLYDYAINYINRIVMTGDLIRTINNTFDLKTIFNTLLHHAIAMVPAADAGTVFLSNEKNNAWQAEAANGYNLDLIQKIKDPLARIQKQFKDNPARCVIEETSKIEEYIADLGKERHELHNQIMNGRTITRRLLVNFIESGQLIGALTLDCFDSKRFFSKDDLEFANDLADQAAAAINNTKLYNANLAQARSLKRKMKESEHLYQISKSISSTLDTNSITAKVLESAKVLIPSDRIEIFKYYPETRMLKFDAAIGIDSDELLGFEIPLGEGVTGNAALQKKPIIVNNVNKSKYFSRKLDKADRMRNILSVPIISKDEVNGVISAVNKRDNKSFTKNDARLLLRFSSNISFALEKAQLYNNAINTALRMKFLNEINNTLNNTFDLHEIFHTILERALGIIPSADAGSVYIGETETDLWQCAACLGYDLTVSKQYIRSYKQQLEQYSRNPFTMKIMDYEQEILPALSTEQRSIHDSIMDGRTLNKALFVNLVIDETLIGRIHLDNFNKDNSFTEEDLEFVEALAEQSTIAVKNALQFEKERKAKITLDNRLKELLIVNSIATTVSMSVDMEQLLSILYSQIYAYFEIDSFMVGLVDFEKRKIAIKVVFDQGIECEGFDIELGQGLTGMVIEKKEPVLLNDFENEIKEYGIQPVNVSCVEGYVTRSWFGIPLKIGESIIGVLKVESGKKNAFPKETQDVLITLSSQVSVAIHNQNMVDEIRKSKDQEEKLRKTFQRFVPADVVSQLVEQEDSKLFQGKNVEAVIMFTDLRNFTTISETMDAKSVVSLLNLYFTAMTNVVIKHGGIIDKFMGDAMLIVFQSDIDYEALSAKAFLASKEMLEVLHEFNKTRPDTNWPDLEMGISVHKGEVIIGNIGSPQKMDYTVIGDTVNLSSRLESLCKFYQTSLILSEPVIKDLENENHFRELDYIAVKGKTKPVKIYEYIFENSPLRNNPTIIHNYRESLNKYRAGQFAEAKESFKKILDILPDDQPTRILIERCEEYITLPPDENWKGEYYLSMK